jgi:aminodeoxyfutalosine synthase
VSGFSLADLEGVAVEQRRPALAVLNDVKSTGLDWIAEVPLDRLLDLRQALDALRASRLRPARVTLQTAHGEAGVDWFRRLRALVAEGADVPSLAPLPRQLQAEPSTGYQDVKQVAIARLLVDNVSSIQVDWRLYGPKLAQVALTFGADDVDAVPSGYDPTLGRRRQPLEEIRRNITACFQTPIERNGRYEPVE